LPSCASSRSYVSSAESIRRLIPFRQPASGQKELLHRWDLFSAAFWRVRGPDLALRRNGSCAPGSACRQSRAEISFRSEKSRLSIRLGGTTPQKIARRHGHPTKRILPI